MADDDAATARRQAGRLAVMAGLARPVQHEINNLLTVVLGNVLFVKRGIQKAGLDGKLLERLDHVRTAAERGATLTAQLLAFSRRQRLEARPVDLNATVSNVRDLLQTSTGARVRIGTALDPELRRALVDPTQIELVLLNLAINARDAMPDGGALTVRVASAVLDARALAGNDDASPGAFAIGRSRMNWITSGLRSHSISESGRPPSTPSVHAMPEVMSSMVWTVIARLRSSRFAMVRSPKKSTKRWSRLSSTPSLSNIATNVPVTALVTDLRRCGISGVYGA